MSPEEIAQIFSNFAMATARSQETAQAAQNINQVTQSNLSRKYQKDLEEQQKKQKKAGVFSQVGSLLGAAALAPLTGGMSLAAQTALTGAGSAVGAGLGGAIGGATNPGELAAGQFVGSLPGVANAWGNQVLNGDVGVSGNKDYSARQVKLAELLSNPTTQAIMQTIAPSAIADVGTARAPIGLNSETAAMLRGQLLSNTQAEQEMALRQQQVDLQRQGLEVDKQAKEASAQLGQDSLEADKARLQQAATADQATAQYRQDELDLRGQIAKAEAEDRATVREQARVNSERDYKVALEQNEIMRTRSDNPKNVNTAEQFLQQQPLVVQSFVKNRTAAMGDMDKTFQLQEYFNTLDPATQGIIDQLGFGFGQVNATSANNKGPVTMGDVSTARAQKAQSGGNYSTQGLFAQNGQYNPNGIVLPSMLAEQPNQQAPNMRMQAITPAQFEALPKEEQAKFPKEAIEQFAAGKSVTIWMQQ